MKYELTIGNEHVVLDGDTQGIDRQYRALRESAPREPRALSHSAFLGLAYSYLEGMGIGGSTEYDDVLPSRRETLASVAIRRIQASLARSRLVQEARVTEPYILDNNLTEYVQRRKAEIEEEMYGRVPLYVDTHR